MPPIQNQIRQSYPPKPMSPKVFISHASEDKDRFVIDFASRLRAQGIDAWLDRWEMLPGDSLVDKLFEEGIHSATAVVIVLSTNSVDKPWVREEINAAFVKHVAGGTKLIPIVLDDCRVPECLASTLWEKISDLTTYEQSFERIVAAITGVRDKPPLGDLPDYITAPTTKIQGLAHVDNLVLEAVCEHALRNGYASIDSDELHRSEALSSLPQQELADSLDVLESEGLVHVEPPGSPFYFVQVSADGFQQFARAYLPDYESTIQDVASAILNENVDSNVDLQAKIGKGQFLINHILDILESQGYIQLEKFGDGRICVYSVSVKFRRAFGA
jgi:hypothetical protein